MSFCMSQRLKRIFLEPQKKTNINRTLALFGHWPDRLSQVVNPVLYALQVEVKVIPHCPFWVFPIVNAVSKKSSLSHPFDGSPMWTLDLLNVFFITYDLEIVEIIAFCWWAAILLNAKRYSRKIISAWQRWENISWTRRRFLTPGTQKLPHPNGTQGYPRPSGSYPRDQILLAY